MNPTDTLPSADELARHWRDSPRWRGIRRGYEPGDVVRLRGTIPIEHSIAPPRSCGAT
jgi:isocitrate lyase